MVQFDQKGNPVRVFARDGAEHAEGRGNGVAAALDGKFDDVFRVKVFRIRREARAGGVLDSLVHRQDGQIAGPGQTAMIENLRQTAQHGRRAIGLRVNPIHKVRPGQMKFLLRNGLAMMFEQVFGAVAQELFKFGMHNTRLIRYRAPARCRGSQYCELIRDFALPP